MEDAKAKTATIKIISVLNCCTLFTAYTKQSQNKTKIIINCLDVTMTTTLIMKKYNHQELESHLMLYSQDPEHNFISFNKPTKKFLEWNVLYKPPKN